MENNTQSQEETPVKRGRGRPKGSISSTPVKSKRAKELEKREKRKQSLAKKRVTLAKNKLVKEEQKKQDEYAKNHVTQNDVSKLADQIESMKSDFIAEKEAPVMDILPSPEGLERDQQQYTYTESEDIPNGGTSVNVTPDRKVITVGNHPKNPVKIRNSNEIQEFLISVFEDERNFFILSEQNMIFNRHIKTYHIEDNYGFKYAIYFDTSGTSSLFNYRY